MRLSCSSLVATLAFLLPGIVGGTDLVKRGVLHPSNYKNITVSRGIHYGYYTSPPTENKRSVLLLHGWPGLAYDWRFQVDVLKEAGYGVIVPDMLGYGGTERPTDPEAYKSSLITRDLVDILDAESLGNNVVVIGHDWGAKVTARLANWFPERFSAFGYLAAGNLPPAFFASPYYELNNLTKAVIGYDLFGYWELFARPGRPQLLEDHLDSLLSVLHSADPVDWITHFAPLGALEAWVKEDRRPSATVWTPEEADVYLKAYSAPGALEASLSWYKIVFSDIEAKDNEGIPSQNLIVNKPVFFGAALADFVVIAAIQLQTTMNSTTNSTLHLYNGGHWIHWQQKDEVNRDLLAWIEGL
ncbi:hypothetical protein V5O48_009887 [Marasmius crinis-equi]|uniref:AB hydrolase-1 domain-containing protein n=1 Tax=Marasmius crinis-equi TaxID=585013 RepID=A0ABR3FA17_9AGAR